MNRKLALIVTLVTLLATSVSEAQSNRDSGAENVTYGYAQVLHASPVYESMRTRVPEQRCDGQGAHCRSVEVERLERRLTAYDIEYEYKGEKYMSRLPYDPGNRLRIRVSVMPDDHHPAGSQ